MPSKIWARQGVNIALEVGGVVSSTRGHVVILDIKDARN